MMKAVQVLVFICALSTVSAVQRLSVNQTSYPSFVSFIAEHKRSYIVGSDEYRMRESLYEDRVKQIQSHNSNPRRLWEAVVNHLTDSTEAELKRLRGLKIIRSAKKSARSAGAVDVHKHGKFLNQVKKQVLPEEVSWKHLDALQQDVNQGSCGSCWAIATSIMMQANAELYGKPRTFSAQELVDCVPNPHNCGGSGGCDGATVELGMNWIADKGLDTAEGTPYYAVDQRCKKSSNLLGSPMLLGEEKNDGSGTGDSKLDDMIAIGFHAVDPSSPAAQIGMLGWERLQENSYEPLVNAVATRGPVAISVAADKWGSYGGGIFDSCHPDSVVDHAVTLIGYGTERASGNKYWHIKNSWSNRWGENGFIRMLKMDRDGYCGTDNKPKDGTGCDGGPPSVEVCGMCGILYDSVVPHFN